MRGGQVDEALVVRVLAGEGGLGRRLGDARMAVEARQHRLGAERVVRQARRDLRVGQHPGQLAAHLGGGDPAQRPRFQRSAQTGRRLVGEDEEVEHDVGVEDDGGRVRHGFSRAEPATMSKRSRRHSIGPFHIGTRRDSFRRMRCGSFMSGVSTQAVQPA